VGINLASVQMVKQHLVGAGFTPARIEVRYLEIPQIRINPGRFSSHHPTFIVICVICEICGLKLYPLLEG
jgi:predicted SprT family Zn-dependent metalloprotease